MNLEKDVNPAVVANTAVFKAKNYRNSPLIREFYRFVAKNGLRNEALTLINEALMGKEKKNSYLTSIKL
jgi:hypothetical protein